MHYSAGRMQRDKKAYVYILTNRSKTLYVGVTSNLERRIWEHKNHAFAGFTERYRIERLVWFEQYTFVRTAIAREKELKGWTRARKMALVVEKNPTWRDLAEDWGKPLEPITPK